MCKISLQKTLADLPYSKNEYSFESKDLTPEQIREHYKKFHAICQEADQLFSKQNNQSRIGDTSLLAAENKQLTEFKEKAMVFYQLLQAKNPELYKEIYEQCK
jgi:hypothetical protein